MNKWVLFLAIICPHSYASAKEDLEDIKPFKRVLKGTKKQKPKLDNEKLILSQALVKDLSVLDKSPDFLKEKKKALESREAAVLLPEKDFQDKAIAEKECPRTWLGRCRRGGAKTDLGIDPNIIQKSPASKYPNLHLRILK